INTAYHSTLRDQEDYLNACYGADAVYLYSSKDSKKAYFKLSGDIGSVNIDDVTLHPYESLKAKPSHYHYGNGLLTHNIRTETDSDFIAYAVELHDTIVLPEGDYFSYDGHHFYNDFYLMSDDYRDGTYDNSVNEEPYYNYYQYLPYRSYSNCNEEEIRAYLSETLGLDQRLDNYLDWNHDGANDEVNRSQLVGTEGDFIACQDLYGANALLLLSSAIYESSYGKSLKSYDRNNLYLSAAYENEEEAETDRYAAVSDSIYSFSKYLISARFGDHLRKDYSGTFLGNKLGGINVNYSLDPYYGEKIAAVYDRLDQTLENHDRDVYALGLVIDVSKANFYADVQLKTLKYRLKEIHETSFIILEETEESYKIRIDNSYSFEYLYDPERSIAYVPKDLFTIILNPEKIHEESFETKHYDFNGGTYHGYSSLDVKAGQKPVVIPSKEGYEFAGYDENGLAQWKEIRDIALKGTFRIMPLHKPIDLRDVFLSVAYDNNESVEFPLTSDMISNFDSDLEGTQEITIHYCGLKMKAIITVSSKQMVTDLKIKEAIDSENYSYIKNNVAHTSYPFSFNEIRKIDHLLRETSERNYVINDHGVELDLGISGLDLSLPDLDTFIYVNDTYYVDVEKIKEADEEKITRLASGYGFVPVLGIDLSFRFNYEDIELQGPAVVQLHIDEKKDGHIYTVYHLNADGDIVKCRTMQTKDAVIFMINEKGSYEILEMPGINDYAMSEISEELTKDNMGFDNHKINIGLLLAILLTLAGISGIIFFDIFNNMRKRMWKDFRKSLQTAESAPEEKPKN
ncbi:MAG: glucosaminidase domain-containing protein, partial [Erysipelotrichaceae bacterium]|nr:glucosaminidase domain-containing protein [Erysipelotrichaceae bacterium]